MNPKSTKAHLIVLLALVLLGLFAANPLLDPRLPEAHDVRFHLYRLVQLDSLIEDGVLFSRWAPELAYGYGYPIFNYYAPTAYYVAEVFHLLGFSFTTALRLTFALALVGMALAMYIWVRDVFGPVPAFVAAVAYTAAPYMMILLLFRGALAELVALALLPAILWATQRFVARCCFGYGVLGAALYALLILTHNITAMLFTVVLLSYGICLATVAWLKKPGRRSWRRMALVILQLLFVLVIGLGLACFFWLPALIERDLVHIYQLYLPAALRFEANFAQLENIFGPPVPADPLLVYQSRPMSSLHLEAVALAIFAVIGVWRLRGWCTQRITVLFALVGAVASIFMALPISAPIWQHVPLLPFVQFPWRFLGLGSFFVALLAGAALYIWREPLSKWSWSWLVVPVLVILLSFYVVPWQYMRRYPPMENLTMMENVRFERQTGSLGTTTMGEFLPATVQALPEENSPALQIGQHLDTTSLPEAAEVLHAKYDPLRYEVLLESSEAFKAVFHTFDFPGWEAEVDGERVPITPTDSHGLISVKVPAGRHRVVVWFGLTPVRVWATGLSVISALALIGMNVILGQRAKHSHQVPAPEPARPGVAWGVLVAVICVLAFKLAYIDREGQQTPLRRTRFDGQSVSGVDYDLTVNFGDQLYLLGMDVPARMTSGDASEITLYWRVPAPVDTEYSVGLALVDERGVRYGHSDHQHPGGYPPTTRWHPEEYAQDPHALRILPGTPPGTYTLQVTVYPYGHPEQTLDVLNADGAPIGRTATLVPATVTRPQQSPSRPQLAPETPVEVQLTADVRLIGYDVPDTPLRPGDALPLTLYWEASSAPETNLASDIVLSGAGGEEMIHLDTLPPVVGYPTSQWRKWDRWRGVHRLLLPPTLEGGEYRVMLDGPGAEPLPLDTVSVQAPDHAMEPLAVTHPQSATFGDLVSLVGYDISPTDGLAPGALLTVDLTWYVHRQTRTAYKTFVHLLDTEGRRVAGSDQVPSGWQRPTTGWIAGEYITDTHILHVPPDLRTGTYRLQTGLYQEGSGERLRRSNGVDTAVLEIAVNVGSEP